DQLNLGTRTVATAVKLGGTPDMTATPAGMTFGNFESVTGGRGGDTFTVAAGAPDVTINGGGGGDTFTLPDGAPPVTLNGGAGADRLDYSQRTAGVSADFAADAD